MQAGVPTAKQIRVRAYQIYLERGCQPGHETDDWLQAEYELTRLPIRRIAQHVLRQPIKACSRSKSLFGVVLHAVAFERTGRTLDRL